MSLFKNMTGIEVIIVGVIVAILGTIIIGTIMEFRACSAAGGNMVGNGKFTTTYTMVGNTMIPSTTEGTMCLVPEKSVEVVEIDSGLLGD